MQILSKMSTQQANKVRELRSEKIHACYQILVLNMINILDKYCKLSIYEYINVSGDIIIVTYVYIFLDFLQNYTTNLCITYYQSQCKYL